MLDLILTLGPYFFGLDFGVLKIPNFGDNIRKYLTFIGPIGLVLAIGLYLPFLPAPTPLEKAKAKLEQSDIKLTIEGINALQKTADSQLRNEEREVLGILAGYVRKHAPWRPNFVKENIEPDI